MGGTSIWHWLVVGVIVMLLFGRGKLSELMGDAAKGIKAFKKGMADEDAPAATTTTTTTSTTDPVRIIEHQTPVAAAPGAGSSTNSAGAGPTPLGERKVG
ncbi:MAG: Twin-arginine translocation protein TatA [uncultured Microvirga sp.]|uniref:Sec-independent protein translocase protein TatA n=1 Tax=uncultured Microvirga sp. TaxID=412392 RepID=A0A6J4MFG9_9HYPH|nr:MAG: Twin-arginine translocation protein TatA [uncultured Microvirga sp.]